MSLFERFRLRKYQEELRELMADNWNSEKSNAQVFQEYFRSTMGKYGKPRTARKTWVPK
jgi:hypothetical protein